MRRHPDFAPANPRALPIERNLPADLLLIIKQPFSLEAA